MKPPTENSMQMPRSTKVMEELIENGYKRQNSPRELQASPSHPFPEDPHTIISNIYYNCEE
jgi:hypothetical protein